jgi:exopolysaccharide production protein ExoZ
VDHAFAVGASGVHIFFVISGFVMVYTSIRSNLKPLAFLKRRLIRIYPIYWVLFGAYLAAHQFLGTAYHIGLGDLGKALLLLPGYSATVIGPGWTLTFEMYFYLCFTIALVGGVRRGLLVLSLFYLASVVAGRLLPPDAPWAKVMTDSLLLEFITGAWLGMIYARGFGLTEKVGAVFIVVALALFGSGFWLDYNRLPSVISWGIPSLLLVTGALAFETRMKSSSGQFFGRLGDSSYFLYLSHVLIVDLIIATPLSSLNRSATAAIAMSFPFALACTAIAAGGYKAIELPLLKGLKKVALQQGAISARQRRI